MNMLGQNNNNLSDLLTNALINQNVNATGNKTSGSPQFPSQNQPTMNDTNIDISNQLQNMPSVANQPITNIFNPIGNPLITAQLFDEGNYGFANPATQGTPMN